MVRPSLEPGTIVDGFTIEECVHIGGMASLWSVTRSDLTTPMLMKIPKIGEGQDPAAIVSFEMEQMIVPRLSGIHVPKFIAAGDFAVQPYIVMERIAGTTLWRRLSEFPLPYDEAIDICTKIATALNDLHRQHVIHLDIKPSNIMFRPGGEAVLLDFGLSHHTQLPDLMQEEFHIPFGTAPYMSPEQLRGIRSDPRSDIFALGALLYFCTTGERPFGENDTMAGMRRRLWRDPVPPRHLKADYPAWLQEIVLRCLEIDPARRYPTAAQLAFDLSHPEQVALTARSARLKRDSFLTVMQRRFNANVTHGAGPSAPRQIVSAPILAVAIDLAEDSQATNDLLRAMAGRLLTTLPSARLACINVLKQSRLTVDFDLDEQGHNKKITRLVALKHWAEPLKLDGSRVTVHVLASMDPAAAIVEFARFNHVDHILIGARQDSLMRSLLGSVSAKVATEADCTVTIARGARPAPQ